MKLHHIEEALAEHHLSSEQVFVDLVRRVLGVDLIPTIAKLEAAEAADEARWQSEHASPAPVNPAPAPVNPTPAPVDPTPTPVDPVSM